jgi:hypothetical protein
MVATSPMDYIATIRETRGKGIGGEPPALPDCLRNNNGANVASAHRLSRG